MSNYNGETESAPSTTNTNTHIKTQALNQFGSAIRENFAAQIWWEECSISGVVKPDIIILKRLFTKLDSQEQEFYHKLVESYVEQGRLARRAAAGPSPP
ncbi:hypothetical protein FRC14_005649 [Serendipita sp. 396]|nr:hypothetical protein FRC14_005649 [Serendipita sp. 396]KAG8780182.1 hypothetical protein FRC15_009702 [Serendipita sp. 397]KAG8797443.1 hypothetical protein FRC16_008864 [Serendipita sp. 398]KAG8850041.1 hypothetical protein FRB91_009405 [Serendipita sp. 411]KAG8865726.1 hypothetical protein FRC20_009557 [Serendipita sp. 405]